MSAEAAGNRDVDARFLLANERTLLAWLRTALSLQAAGFVLVQFSHQAVAAGIGLALVALGAGGAASGYIRYRAADRSMRAGQLPASGRAPAVITAGVVALAVAMLAWLLLSHR